MKKEEKRAVPPVAAFPSYSWTQGWSNYLIEVNYGEGHIEVVCKIPKGASGAEGIVRAVTKCLDEKYGVKKIPTTVDVETPEEKAKKKYDGFDIEHMIAAESFYPRYKGQYIFCDVTKAYTLCNAPDACECATSKEGAKKIIDVYLELKGVGTKILKVEDK